jgi:hypothetical protein
MAKGQLRGNRETKKPKQKKEPVAATVTMKGALAPVIVPKKKA